MAALDTNVLVRFLVQDDVAQLSAARRLIGRCIRENESLFVPATVSLELEWVLRSNYGFTKADIVRVLSQLLSSTELSFEAESALEIALATYSETRADYADCLHLALAVQAGQQPLWTFDRTASKLEGARLLAS